MSVEEASGSEVAAEQILAGTADGRRLIAGQLDHLGGLTLFLAMLMGLPAFMPQAAAGVFAIASYFAYYFLTEWLCGATPGKQALGLVVRQLSGQPCTAKQIALRTATRLIETNVALLGGLPAGIVVLLTKRHQRIGDMLASTVVIKKSQLYAPHRTAIRIITNRDVRVADAND